MVLYIVAFLAVKYFLEFPLNCYQGFFRAHAYGLSNQSFGRWLGYSLKGLAVDTTVGALFVWIPFLLMRKSPRRWWLYAWMAATTAAAFMVFITPVWIDPLFNRFGPMQDKELETEILALAEDGRSNKEIGAPLGITERTVKAHVAKLMRKVGVQNRIALSVHAITNSLVFVK